MKQYIITTLMLCSIGIGSASAQTKKPWEQMNPKEKKDILKKLTPEQRSELILQHKREAILKRLNLSEEKAKVFTPLYEDYQKRMKAIKHSFKPSTTPERLTDKEAKEELKQSFIVARQLLEEREVFAEKLQQVLTPQQIIKMFQAEGALRGKILNIKTKHFK